jgi:hypothetical protein
MPRVQSFVRAEMLPSGYLIRPCDGGGCIIHIVDHVDLEVELVQKTLSWLLKRLACCLYIHDTVIFHSSKCDSWT